MFITATLVPILCGCVLPIAIVLIISLRKIIAVALAGICGFAMGVVLTLIYPMIEEMLASFRFKLPTWHENTMTLDFSHVGWLLVAGISVITSLTVYEMTLRSNLIKTED